MTKCKKRKLMGIMFVGILAFLLIINPTVKLDVHAEEGYGTVTGSVTYFYNDFRGNVADTNAQVYLIPNDGSANNVDIQFGFTDTDMNYLTPYKFFATKVSGMGTYTFSHVPTGSYTIVIISKNTTNGGWFNNTDDDANTDEAYLRNLAKRYTDYQLLNEKSAMSLVDDGYLFYKYYIQTIDVYSNETAVHDTDFGVSYS